MKFSRGKFLEMPKKGKQYIIIRIKLKRRNKMFKQKFSLRYESNEEFGYFHFLPLLHSFSLDRDYSRRQ